MHRKHVVPQDTRHRTETDESWVLDVGIRIDRLQSNGRKRCIGIVGVDLDDTAIAETVWPELTTIHQPLADLSRLAVDLAIEKIRARRAGERAPPRHIVLDHTLVRRQSDAVPSS